MRYCSKQIKVQQRNPNQVRTKIDKLNLRALTPELQSGDGHSSSRGAYKVPYGSGL